MSLVRVGSVDAIVLAHAAAPTFVLTEEEVADPVLATQTLQTQAEWMRLAVLQQHDVPAILHTVPPTQYRAIFDALATVLAVPERVAAVCAAFERIEAACQAQQPWPCAGPCQQLIPWAEGQPIDLPGVRGRVCAQCLPAILAAHTARITKRSLRSALSRARAAHREATLTEAEWTETLNAFEQCCAYCGGVWHLIEHIDPIEQGGGTTQRNCVPACYRCNATKGSRAFEQLRTLFDPTRLDRVLAWTRG